MAQSLEFGVVGKSNASQVMGQAGKEADKLSKKLKEAFDIKGALTNAFIGAFGAAALLDKTIQTLTESFKEMGDVSDKAAKAGISGEEFDQLSFAAGLAGVQTTVLSKSIRELRFNMKDAQKDTDKMNNLTKGLGFTEEEVRNGQIKSIDVFNRVAVAVAQAQTDTEKLTILTKFFGDKVANDMLPVMEQIAKNPDIFKGLVTASEKAYDKLDKLDEKAQKLERNMKRLIGIGMYEVINKNEEETQKPSAIRSFLGGMFPSLNLAANALGYSTMEGNTKKVDATQAQKDGAKFLAQETAKANKGDNTIANSLGASMGNGPTSGVIGVGNNATFSLMEEQLDALKQIKDAIDRLGPISPMNTDFTKPEYPTA